ncbi:hypothetical protein Vadar_022648 [Vaccinium darrowii]|uniref:Uncharacterized protein n=1 Tax=Vaccinium darrowii TaxID=229202 RepID=A0ACB7ZDN1_9ERIC|nr:hypothetical protein Vadar_022648 [Vaccinium darrowii]
MAEDGVVVGIAKGSEPKEYLRNQRYPQNGLLPQPKGSSKPKYHKPRIKPTNWAAGGSGMQAFFLDSGPRTGGTGVFLPRRAGFDFHPTKKPACSPVLLPSRVVQALNLNVHELGLQIKPPKDINNDSKSIDRDAKDNKKGKNGSTHCCVLSQSRNASPEIFLPKEWTY